MPGSSTRATDKARPLRAPKHCRCWDYYRQRFERDRGLKIDFVLGSPSLAARVKHAFVDRDERDPARFAGSPSDHAPVIVDLN